MKISINKIEFPLYSKNAVIPACECYKIVADNDIRIIGTDLETFELFFVEGTIHEKGECLVPAEKFKAIAKGNFTIESDEKITIKTSTGKYTFGTMDGFPDIPEVDGDVIRANADWFEVAYCCAKDELRPAFTGVYWGDEICATDATRLASKDIQGPGVILPTGAIKRLTGDYMASFNDRNAKFTNGFQEVITRLVNAKFPDYKQIIPKPEYVWKVNAKELIQSIKRCLLFNEQIIFENGKIAARNETGTATEQMPGECNFPEAFSVNGKLFAEMLSYYEGDVEIKLTASNKPIMIEEPFMSLVMPIILQ